MEIQHPVLLLAISAIFTLFFVWLCVSLCEMIINRNDPRGAGQGWYNLAVFIGGMAGLIPGVFAGGVLLLFVFALLLRQGAIAAGFGQSLIFGCPVFGALVGFLAGGWMAARKYTRKHGRRLKP